MRRMYSEKGIYDTVNKGIQEGEIEAGGGLPEIESGDAGKALVVNSEETGVKWENINDKVLTVDFAGSTYLDITDTDVQTKLENKYYNKIIVKHYNSTSTTYIITASLTSNIKMNNSGQPELADLDYYIDNHTADGTIPFSFSGIKNCSVAGLGDMVFTGFGAANGNKWRLSYTSHNHRLSVDIGFNYGQGWFRNSPIGDVELTTAGGVIPGASKIQGTDGGSLYQKPKGYANAYVYFYKEGDDKVILRPTQYQFTADLGWNPIVVLKGEHYNITTGVKDYEYVAILHCNANASNSSYTLTRTAIV